MKNFTYLIILIEPKESQIGNSNWLPMILDLLSSAVDHMGNFICYDKFKILHFYKRR